MQQCALLLLISTPLQSGANCGGSQLNFPRLSFVSGTVTGAAVVNPNGVPAPITITAYDTQGDLLQGAVAVNPFSTTIQPNAQFAMTTAEIFGAGDPQAIAWFQVCSPVADLTGFFLFLDIPTTLMDGTDLPISAEKIVFHDVRVDGGLATEINIVNPGDVDADLLLQLLSGGSTPVAAQSAQVNTKGVLRLDVETFFGVSDLAGGALVVVTSGPETPIAGFELIGPAGLNGSASAALGKASDSATTASALPDAIALTARPALETLETLFFPQLAVSEDIGTEISVSNYTVLPEIVTLSAYRPDGELWGAETVNQNRVTRNLAGGATIRLDAKELFGFPAQGVFQGWIKVEGTRASINGSISYSIQGAGSFAAVSSVPAPRTSAIFSHLATAQNFFTGVAGLNAGAFPADVKVIAMRQDGQLLGEYRTTLTPGQRFAQVVSTVIPAAEGQAGGIVWVKSDVPVYLTSIFGFPDGGLPNVLANVPPQPVPAGYRPDQGKEFLDIRPIQTVLEPDAVQTFVNQDGGSTTWRINNLTNPDPSLGQIMQDGTYMAPGSAPQGQPVTIAASTSNNIGAAAADIVLAEEFLSGFGLLQSLVHLEALDALFTAELFAASGLSVTAHPAGAQTTKVFEVQSQNSRVEIAKFANETISKMLPFQASDGGEYLILANQTSGEIVGLDPGAPVPVVIQAGLNQPTTMAYDAQGNLVVADLNGFATISRGAVEIELEGASASVGPGSRSVAGFRARTGRPADTLPFLDFHELDIGLPAGGSGAAPSETARPVSDRLPSFVLGTPGFAFDRCTGDLFVSDPAGNSVVRIDRTTGEVTHTFTDISSPGQILPFYRREVGCPFSFTLLVVERGKNQILLLNPARGFRPVFARATDTRDLIFIGGDSDFGETVLFTDGSLTPSGTPSGSASGRIFRADVPELWRRRPTNPPQVCQGDFFLNDPVLHQSVTLLLDLAPTSPVNCEQAQSVTQLTVIGSGVSDLGNIHFLSGLRQLILPLNQISDLTPLTQLPGLLLLDLQGNQISDLLPLQQLTSLQILDVSGNPIASLNPLTSLVRLLALNLGSTGNSNLSALSTLTNLQVLFLGGNGIGDLTSLGPLTNLVDLRLENNNIQDLQPLAGLINLVTLNLLSNDIGRAMGLEKLAQLEKLELGFNRIVDLSPLSGLIRLRELGASNNVLINDLGPVSGLRELRIFLASGNQIPRLDPLMGLLELVDLRLNSNDVTQLEPLTALSKLDNLQFRGNRIMSLGPLVPNGGLGQGDLVDARANPLSANTCPHIIALEERGVNLLIDDAVRASCF